MRRFYSPKIVVPLVIASIAFFAAVSQSLAVDSIAPTATPDTSVSNEVSHAARHASKLRVGDWIRLAK